MPEPTSFPAPKSDLTVLVLGSGGREHALAFKLAQSPRVKTILIAPGNGGTALIGGKCKNVSVPWGGKAGYAGAAKYAQEQGVDLVVPGPEQPLVDGAEAEFRKGEF
jgi:phosphoribosylamine--glycine ligase/phosphoribosylformylglycinamidine cyclo-ligase